MAAKCDSNLLMGILALQLDFIDRDQLVKSLNDWVLNKQTPLHQILREMGALSGDTEALLLAVVQKHLEMHEGDVEKSLAAVSSLGSVADELRAMDDPVIDETLTFASRRDGGSPRPDSMDAPTGRYSILRPHAKGGLGEVSLARDEELRREVAVKLLQERYATDAGNRARFVAEAEITGNLEHPGIVPVYGLGVTPEGRPFYAMRFIRGDSLRDAAIQFHNERRAPSDRRLELRKLLGRFIDVCEAIEYAHTRGVVHRDLKPGNIMLGRFGETLVVDWGLAKSVGRDEPDRSALSTIRPSGSGSSSRTSFGSALGTPAYMSPEQASGRIDALGPASDVFGLGATLYFVLTGRPPIEGRNAEQVIARAKEGDFPPPRRVNPGVPKQLNALCLKAMAFQPEDRYASPRELAEDVERWLADAEVLAFPDSPLRKCFRWVRRNSHWVAATAVVALLAIASGWGLAWQSNQARRRISEEKRRVEQAQRQAQRNFGRALTAVDKMLTRVGSDTLADAPFMSDVRRKLLTDALTFYEENLGEADDDFPSLNFQTARSRYVLGKCYLLLGRHREALEALRDAESQFDRIDTAHISGKDLGIASAQNLMRLGETLLLLENPDEAADKQIAAIATLDRLSHAGPERDLDLLRGKIYELLAAAYRASGETQQASGALSKATACLERVLEQPSEKDEETLFALQLVWHSQGALQYASAQLPEAEASLRKALAYQNRLLKVAGAKPWYAVDRASSLMRLSNVLQDLGRIDDAIQGMSSARDVFEKLAILYPDVRHYRVQYAASCHNLGERYLWMGRFREARQPYSQSIEILEAYGEVAEPVVTDRADLANSYMRLAEVEANVGAPGDARQLLERAAESMETAVKLAPDSFEYVIQLAGVRHNSAILYEQMGQLDSAEHGFRESIRLLESLDPQQARLLQSDADRANSWMALAGVQQTMARPEQADASYRRASQIFKALFLSNPDVVRYPWMYAASQHNHASLLREMDVPDAAIAGYRESIRVLHEEAIPRFPEVTPLKRDLSNSHLELAKTLHSLERRQEAQREIARAAAVASAMMVEDPDNADFRTIHALARLQQALISGDVSAAVELARNAGREASSPADQYNAACFHGACLKAVEDDAVAAMLRQEAVRLLADSWRSGYGGYEQTSSDSDLEELHGYAEFDELLEGMKSASQEPQAPEPMPDAPRNDAGCDGGPPVCWPSQ